MSGNPGQTLALVFDMLLETFRFPEANRLHFLWVFRRNKPSRDVGRSREKLVNLESGEVNIGAVVLKVRTPNVPGQLVIYDVAPSNVFFYNSQACVLGITQTTRVGEWVHKAIAKHARIAWLRPLHGKGTLLEREALPLTKACTYLSAGNIPRCDAG